MSLHLEPITSKNLDQVRLLKVLPEQAELVGDLPAFLAQTDRRWRMLAICQGSAPVGFVAYGLFPQEPSNGRLWVDELLIDAHHQGRGYARRAMTLLLAQLEGEYGARPVYLSVYESNRRAIALYQSLGFAFTGERDALGAPEMVRFP